VSPRIRAVGTRAAKTAVKKAARGIFKKTGPKLRKPRHLAGGGSGYRKTFFAKHPHLKGKVWVHHAVPRAVMKRYPGRLTWTEMHALDNLRGIPKGRVNDRLHLSVLRRQWERFYRNNPNATRQDLYDFAARMDKRYGKFFDPPVIIK
jgi:hypothetical protein